MRQVRIEYDDQVVRQFAFASILFGAVGLLVGVLIATQLAWWQANVAPYFSFSRLRPLHTNAVIFAFVGNAFFAGWESACLLRCHLLKQTRNLTHET